MSHCNYRVTTTLFVSAALCQLFSCSHATYIRNNLPVKEGPLDGLLDPVGHSAKSLMNDDSSESVERSEEKEELEEAEKSEKESEKETQKAENFYCNHMASCGSRSDPGPPTADSSLSGYECYCRGEAQVGLAYMCYKGHCYDELKDPYRTPSNIDKYGLCGYTTKNQADVEFCQRSESNELSDPNLQAFTSPPFLVDEADQKSEIAVSEKIGAEDQQ
jgi:hypothetical protein